MAQDSVFKTLNAVNCNEHTEQKNGLTYLSWAWAWGYAKTYYPNASYTVYESRDGWNYFTDGRTCWVKTGVTIEGQEHIEYLPVMDFKNRSIPAEQVTSFDVNKAIQRSLTKALARHGLGLYIYAGEDLPSEADDETRAEVNRRATDKTTQGKGKPVIAEGNANWSKAIEWLNADETRKPEDLLKWYNIDEKTMTVLKQIVLFKEELDNE